MGGSKVGLRERERGAGNMEVYLKSLAIHLLYIAIWNGGDTQCCYRRDRLLSNLYILSSVCHVTQPRGPT